MTPNWQILYQETQNLARIMEEGWIWQVFSSLGFGDWFGIVIGCFFLIVPFLGGMKSAKRMGCFLFFWEGFTIFWLMGWVGFSVMGRARFSSTPYLLTIQKCDKKYNQDDKSYYIIGIPEKEEKITTTGLKYSYGFSDAEKEHYWVSPQVFEQAKRDTSNQLILINDIPVGILKPDGSFLLDY